MENVNLTPTQPETQNVLTNQSKPRNTKIIIVAFFVVLVLLIIGLASAFALGKKSNSPSPTPTPETVACTMEAKLCPDGVTYVGRSGSRCEFEACPAASASNSATADWKTYTNSKFGFTFKYPQDWKTTTPYDPKSSPNIGLNLGLAPNSRVKTGSEYVISMTKYDNPDNLSFQDWDKKRNEGPGVVRYLNTKDTKPANLAGLTAYINDEGSCEPVVCEQIIIMGKNNVYLFERLDFTNMGYTREETESYKPIFNEVASSFKFN